MLRWDIGTLFMLCCLLMVIAIYFGAHQLAEMLNQSRLVGSLLFAFSLTPVIFMSHRLNNSN